MSRFIKPFSAFLFTLFLALNLVAANDLALVKPEQVGMSSERLTQVDRYFQEQVDEEHVAGATVLIARKGKIVYLKAFGHSDREAKKTMETNAVFRLASMTKTITASAVMMLVEEGRIQIQDPLSKYLPEFKDMKVLIPCEEGEEDCDGHRLVPADRPITIHHLLTHSSGLSYILTNYPFISKIYKEIGISDGISQTDATLKEMVEKLAKAPLACQPGEKTVYGLNMDVLGRVIEVVSGMPLDQFFEKRIFEPLEMKETRFFLDEDLRKRMPPVYQPNGKGGLVRIPESVQHLGDLVYSVSYPYDGPKSYFSGGAGLSSTISDYAHFLQMMLNGGRWKERQILSPASTSLMIQRHSSLVPDFFPGYKVALGGLVHVDPIASGSLISEGSFMFAGFFYTGFHIDPKQELMVVFMTQVFPFTHLDILQVAPNLASAAVTVPND